MREDTAASRAKRGAELLDARRPGWVDEINPDRLDMRDGVACVIGQLFDGYSSRHVEALMADPYDHGFHGRFSGGRHLNDTSYPADCQRLTAAWLDLIEERRAEGPPAPGEGRFQLLITSTDGDYFPASVFNDPPGSNWEEAAQAVAADPAEYAVGSVFRNVSPKFALRSRSTGEIRLYEATEVRRPAQYQAERRRA